MSAAYALYLYRRIIFGVLDKPSLASIRDLSWREAALFAPLIALTIFYGVYPAPVLESSAASINALIKGYDTALAVTKTAALASTKGFIACRISPPALAHCLPELILAAGILVLVLFGAFRGKEPDGLVTEIAAGLLGVAIVVILLGGNTMPVVFDGAFIDDGFGRFMKVLTLAGSLVTLVMSQDFLARRENRQIRIS